MRLTDVIELPTDRGFEDFCPFKKYSPLLSWVPESPWCPTPGQDLHFCCDESGEFWKEEEEDEEAAADGDCKKWHGASDS